MVEFVFGATLGLSTGILFGAWVAVRQWRKVVDEQTAHNADLRRSLDSAWKDVEFWMAFRLRDVMPRHHVETDDTGPRPIIWH